MIMGLEHMQSTNAYLEAVMGMPSSGPSAFSAEQRPGQADSRQQQSSPAAQSDQERRASHAAAGPSGPSGSLPEPQRGSSSARQAPSQPRAQAQPPAATAPPATERRRPPGLPLHHSAGAGGEPPPPAAAVAWPTQGQPGAGSSAQQSPQHRRSRSLGEGRDAAHLASGSSSQAGEQGRPDSRRMVSLASRRLQAALDSAQPAHRRSRGFSSPGGSRDWEEEDAGWDSDATSFVTAGSHLEAEPGQGSQPAASLSYQTLSGLGEGPRSEGSLQSSPLAAMVRVRWADCVCLSGYGSCETCTDGGRNMAAHWEVGKLQILARC